MVKVKLNTFMMKHARHQVTMQLLWLNY